MTHSHDWNLNDCLERNCDGSRSVWNDLSQVKRREAKGEEEEEGRGK